MTENADRLLEAERITVGYDGPPVIEDLTVSVHTRSFVGLIGPNGAGKSTLLKCLAGQFRPESGRVFYRDLDVYQENVEFKRLISYVHENPFFYPYLNAEEFLDFISRIKRVPKEDIPEKVESVLSTVQLLDQKKKLTADFSLGMRKKLAIGAAMLGDPGLIFLDEALSGIDVEGVFQIKQWLADLAVDGGTVILSSHTLEVLEKICDRFLVLKGGKIIADLKSDQFQTPDLESRILQLLKD